MKRWKLFLAAAAFAVLLPKGQGVDAAKLNPVMVLYLYMEGNRVVLETDVDAVGRGASVQSAVEDLRQTAQGRIYLDTTEYLLVTEQTQNAVPELKTVLRPSTAVIRTEGEIEMESLSPYLQAREIRFTLRDYLTTGLPLPVLRSREGRYYVE